MADERSSDNSRSEGRVLTPRRIIGFVLTAGVFLALLYYTPVDEERAVALTTANLAGSDILPVLGEAFRTSHDLPDDEPITARLDFATSERVRAELVSTAQRQQFELVEGLFVSGNF